jgi:hypothetical protein
MVYLQLSGLARDGTARWPDGPFVSLTAPTEEVAVARTTPPFRADHVGSLLRPAWLLRAREDLAAGRTAPAGLRMVETVEGNARPTTSTWPSSA